VVQYFANDGFGAFPGMIASRAALTD